MIMLVNNQPRKIDIVYLHISRGATNRVCCQDECGKRQHLVPAHVRSPWPLTSCCGLTSEPVPVEQGH